MEKEDVADSLISKLYKWWQSRITSSQLQDRLPLDTYWCSALIFPDLSPIYSMTKQALHNTCILKSSIKTLHTFCSVWLDLFTDPFNVYTLERSVFLHPSPFPSLSSLVDTHQFLTSVISRLEAFYDIKTRWTNAKPEKLTMQDNKSMQKHRYVE